MKRTLTFATVLLLTFTGAAFAGRGRGGGGGPRNGQGGVVVRDHRAPAPVYRNNGPRYGGGGYARGGGHVRVTNGRYVFPGGVVRVYNRPVIRARYYNRAVRPAIIVEQYDPVPGYVWVAGSWNWGGAEWVWSPGYWAVAAEPAPPPAPVVQGGFSVGASISIH